MFDEVQTYRPHIIHRLTNFRFAALVTARYEMVCGLEILFLRPEPPGGLITKGGDIDNRLKTLFDALRMPRVPEELPAGDVPAGDEDPFFCLLEDDALITAIDVRTDVLLDPSAHASEALLTIRVQTRLVEANFYNLGL